MLFLFCAAGTELGQLWRKAPPARRFLYSAGLFLMISGLFHLAVFLVQGGSWEGPLSLRKPILFGFSGGVTLLSLAWVIGLITESPVEKFRSQLRKFEPSFCFVLALAMLLEVALITLQTWRGVPSHFNQSTPVNAAIFYVMGLMILLVSAQVALLILASWVPLSAPSDVRWAARAGLLLLLLGCALGFWILRYGVLQAQAHLAPEIYGARGVMKFPHGLPIHALQYLALQSWLLIQFRLAEVWRLRLIILSSLGLFLVTVYGLIQTLAGRGRFEFTAETALLFFFSAGLVLLPFAVAGILAVKRFFAPEP